MLICVLPTVPTITCVCVYIERRLETGHCYCFQLCRVNDHSGGFPLDRDACWKGQSVQAKNCQKILKFPPGALQERHAGVHMTTRQEQEVKLLSYQLQFELQRPDHSANPGAFPGVRMQSR